MTLAIGRRTAQGGFTLLELLIALFLTSLLTVLVYGGLNVGISSWDKVINRNEQTSDAFLTQRFLRRLLGKADSGFVTDAVDDKESAGLLGLEHELLFIAALPRFENLSNPVWAYISLVRDEQDVGRLQLATLVYDPDQSVEWEVLLESFRNGLGVNQYVLTNAAIDEIKFQYLEIDGFGESLWVSEWRLMREMPVAIKIQVMTENRITNGWPELVVTLPEYAYEIRDSR